MRKRQLNKNVRARLQARGIYVSAGGGFIQGGQGLEKPKIPFSPTTVDEGIPTRALLRMLRKEAAHGRLGAWERAVGAPGSLQEPVYGSRPMGELIRRRLSRVVARTVRGELWLLRFHKGRSGGVRYDLVPAGEAARLIGLQNAVERSTRYGTLGYGLQA